MPNIRTGAPAFGAASLNLAFDEFSNPPYRGIEHRNGRIVAQVTVSEDHDDDLIITEHPVQAGAAINDHAFKRPAELRVQIGFSNAYASDYNLGSVKAIYEQILALQATRLPFRVYTARRIYNNMLVASLRTHTDARLEFSLLADIAFKEVVLVNTSVIAVSPTTLNQQETQWPELNTPQFSTGTLNAVSAIIQDAQAEDLIRPVQWFEA